MVRSKEFKCLLISNFTIDNFAGYLNNDEHFPAVKSIVAPFNQVIQVLKDKDLDCWKNNPDFAVVWTQPGSVIKSFNEIIERKKVSLKKIYKEIDEYSSLLIDICGRLKFVFVPVWVLHSYDRGLGMLEMKNGVGISNILMYMNLRLSKNLDRVSNICLLNTQRWINLAGKGAFNPKLWYMGKIAFGNEVFIEAVIDIKSAIKGVSGDSKKLIIVDLDDVLWGGIVGEVGWENIKLGGHDPIGEAYVDFQRALKALTNRGILLAVVSKNEEPIAVEAIKKHPEMVLKLDDFSGWRINWRDKAQNIAELVSDLNIGLQSVVFIDDSPVERARVRETLPDVFVPDWTEDKMLYKSTLLNLDCFDSPSITKEDIEKSRMYITERKRENLKNNVGSLDEWLKCLKIRVKAEELSKTNLQRTVQLLNKTNQMNLTTRRMTESELLNWATQSNNKLWTFRISDKFGDSGLTGIISLEVKNKIGRIVDFVLSCRVMGRKVEESMLYTTIKYTKSIGLDEIYAQYIPTAKNKPCLEFWKRSGFIQDGENNIFRWEASKEYPVPDCIQMEGDGHGN